MVSYKEKDYSAYNCRRDPNSLIHFISIWTKAVIWSKMHPGEYQEEKKLHVGRKDENDEYLEWYKIWVNE